MAAADLARVRGTFAYAVDVALPGMLHSMLVRSPQPHAEILAIDAAAACSAGRVVVRWRVLPPVPTIAAALAPDAPALFDQGPQQPCPKGPQAEAWREPARDMLWRFHFRIGDRDAVFARPAHIFTNTDRFLRMSHLPIEPLCAVARRDNEGGSVVQQSGSVPAANGSRPHSGLPEAAIRVLVLPAGAGFGAKSCPKHETLTLLLSRLARGSVRLALTWGE